MAAAKDAKSNSRLSQSGSLSGFQLFVKINCTLSQFGEAQVDAPPERPQFPDLAPASFTITNTGGVAALKLGCPSDPGANTIIRGCKPVSQGRETCRDFRPLGMCPAPVRGSADITSLYAARFGAPPAAKKVYIQVNQFIDGWEDLPVTFSAIVPAGTKPPAGACGRLSNCPLPASRRVGVLRDTRPLLPGPGLVSTN